MHSANVSAIHLCQRCPRLLGYQLRGHRHLWKVGLSGSGQLPGALFHDRIAAPFHTLLAAGAQTPLSQRLQGLLHGPLEHLDSGLLALLEALVFVPAMRRHGQSLRAEQIVQLGRGLELWSRHLAQFLRTVCAAHPEPRETLLARCFQRPEVLLEATYPLDDGRWLRVTGRYDALLFDLATGEAVVMEFKGHQAGRADEDLLQLALYGWLLHTTVGVMPRGVLLYLEETEPEVGYSAADLQQAIQQFPPLFRQVLAVLDTVWYGPQTPLPAAADPHLCRRCPFEARCDQDWGPRR